MRVLFLLLFVFFCKFQSQEIQILNLKNKKPLQDVLVYKNNFYLGVTSRDGKLTISTNSISDEDTLIFNKNNFETLKLKKNDINKTILMDSIIYKTIEPITFYNYDKVSLFSKIKEKIEDNYSYRIAPYFQQSSFLKLNNNNLLYYNDKFYTNAGSTISNVLNNNFYADFKVITRNDKKYQQKYHLYDGKYVFSRNFTCLIGINLKSNEVIQQILNNPKNFKIESYSNEEALKITILFKSKNLEGKMIIDPKDYGIYEFQYIRTNFKEKSDEYFEQKPQKYYFFDEKENYSFQKADNYYILESYSTLLNFKNESLGGEFRFEAKKSLIEKFDTTNLKKVSLCDLN